MFFPVFVLGTINAVMSPVVKGCNSMLKEQTFNMNKYREQKDELERAAMLRNPEKAYLVSDEPSTKRSMSWVSVLKILRSWAVCMLKGLFSI